MNKKDYIKIGDGYLWTEYIFLFTTENNGIVCALTDEDATKAFLVGYQEKETLETKEKISCELFKKTNPKDLELIFVQNDTPVIFDRKCTFSLLPYNFEERNIKFEPLFSIKDKKTLTNTEGFPILASIEKGNITIFYKEKGILLYDWESWIPEDKRDIVKLVKKESSIMTKFKDICCCCSYIF